MSSSQATTRKQRRSGAHGRDLSGFCPRFHHAVELIGRRWTGAIVRALCGGPLRFNELLSTIPGLSDRLLTERLRELEREHIVLRVEVLGGCRVLPGLVNNCRLPTPITLGWGRCPFCPCSDRKPPHLMSRDKARPKYRLAF